MTSNLIRLELADFSSIESTLNLLMEIRRIGQVCLIKNCKPNQRKKIQVSISHLNGAIDRILGLGMGDWIVKSESTQILFGLSVLKSLLGVDIWVDNVEIQ